jgi:hypothetical protein
MFLSRTSPVEGYISTPWNLGGAQGVKAWYRGIEDYIHNFSNLTAFYQTTMSGSVEMVSTRLFFSRLRYKLHIVRSLSS